MKALTLHGIHAWSIMFAGKDVENRSWVPSKKLIGQRIAVHAGQKQGGSREDLQPGHPEAPKQFPRSVILGTVVLKGYVFGEDSMGLTKAQIRAAQHSEWGGGPCMWVLEDPQPFAEPVPCGGKLGLWDAPDLGHTERGLTASDDGIPRAPSVQPAKRRRAS